MDENEIMVENKKIQFVSDSKYCLNYHTFQTTHKQSFKILHLNVNCLRGDVKQQEIKNILKSGVFDLIFLNETKLDSSFPHKFMNPPKYNVLRRDRNGNTLGGGIMVFIKKSYSIISSAKSDDFESLLFVLKLHDTSFTFIYTYRSPKVNQQDYLEHLDKFINFNCNLNDPFYIIGDLNMDLSLNADGKLENYNGKYLYDKS